MGDFPSPVRHRCDVHGVLSSAMPLRYDRLYRITSREREYVCAGVRVTRVRSRESWKVREEERERGRDEILFLYGDRGGCPVFRVTWLNGIALAHSCPLRRDGRLASRIFLPLLSPALPVTAPPNYTRPSHSRLARASLANAREKTVCFFFFFSFFFPFGRDSKRSAARLITILARMPSGKTRLALSSPTAREFAIVTACVRDSF